VRRHLSAEAMRKSLVAVIAVAALAMAWFPRPSLAATQTSCAVSLAGASGNHNVCLKTITVGTGPVIEYSWTLNHNQSNSSLKVRFRSLTAYTGNASPVAFRVTMNAPGTAAFTGFATLKNPAVSTIIPPTQTVDVTNKWVERRSATGLTGTVDYVQEVKFDAAAAVPTSVRIDVTHHGATGNAIFNVYFDPTAPSNRDEGESMTAIYGAGHFQCNDATDNDVDYRLNCADSNCLGKSLNGSAPISVCEAAENDCDDAYDNDGDGLLNCTDLDCNGQAAPLAGKFCGPENGGAAHANCQDAFDNDGNGKTDCADDVGGTGCWKTGFKDCAASEDSDAFCVDNIDNDRDQDELETIDAVASTGIDCRDFDCACGDDQACANLRHCPISERLSWNGTAFVDAPAQCFDAYDNDLDGKKNCADPDCIGVVSGGSRCSIAEAFLPPSTLGTGVFPDNPAFYFNYCSDGIDNDGVNGADGADPSCRARFGQCGPWPTIEDYRYLSCSDGIDNDFDGLTDCADNNGGGSCRANDKLGRRGCATPACGGTTSTLLTDAAQCRNNESHDNVCGDGFDNDADGQIDCSDADCSGRNHGPTVFPGYVCGTENAPVANCSDGFDNDSDADIDCFDSQCQDGAQCALRNWTPATCINVPNTTAPAKIVPGMFTDFYHHDRIHVNGSFRIRFSGTGTYTSLTIVVGDANDVSKRFPFDARNCTLNGTGVGSMTYLSNDATVGTVIMNAGATLNGFDVWLQCSPTSATPAAADDFTVAIVATRGGVVEFGQSTPTVQVYENVAPTLAIPAVDVEGIQTAPNPDRVDIPVGGSVRFQAKPSADPSGICRCDFMLNGVPTPSGDGNCIATSPAFANDVSGYTLSASSTDGAANVSANSAVQTFNVNVTPSILENMTVTSSATTYREGDNVTVLATFQTDSASDFNVLPSACQVYACNSSWGCSAPVTIAGTAVGSNVTCSGSYAVPSSFPDGRYWIYVTATENKVTPDTVRSNVQSFLHCDAATATGDCADADFDGDGVPEGRTTPGGFASPPTPDYLPIGTPSSCDNCLNYPNSSQNDLNGNGMGDVCEASAVGRCQYKRCGTAPDDPAPGAFCDEDADCTDPAKCVVVSQPMCAINCASDTDCNKPIAPEDGGKCIIDWGVCKGPAADVGLCCFANSDCLSSTCESLVQPYIEALDGQIYAGNVIKGKESSPRPNATYCLQATGEITNFSSGSSCSLAGSTGYEIPSAAKGYLSALGGIDVPGIIAGKYGPLQTGVSMSGSTILDGKVYYYDTGTPELTVNGVVFQNGGAGQRGNGLIVVKGDLAINGDVSYDTLGTNDLSKLASVGWIVLKRTDGTGGNVTISPDVKNFVGAVFAEGTLSTGNSATQLNVTGMLVAKNFSFERLYASRTGGAEKITFDARAVLNPPPGMSDISRALPGFRSVPGQ
jgi:hypothetical protein